MALRSDQHLVGVRGKIDRADKHFQEVDSTVEVALRTEAEHTRIPPFEYQPDRQHLVITHPKPDPIAPFVHDKALTAIQDLQPYKTGYPGTGWMKPLWVLSQLDILDKHRLLVVVARQVRATGFSLTFPGGEYISSQIESEWQPMEDGAEVAHFDLSPFIKTEGKVSVNIYAASQVYFKDTELFCDGMFLLARIAYPRFFTSFKLFRFDRSSGFPWL